MIARAEMSTNMQNSEREPGVSGGMSVAVIGPNDAHRQIVAHALSLEDGRSIYQFADYPSQLNDLPRFLGQNFDVVLVDVDTDESYAMQIIEKLAELGPAVMAYSARNDQELLMTCMRAGARDFLPLPSENNSAPSPAPEPTPVAATSQVIPRPAEPRIPPPNHAPVVARPSEPKPGAVSIAPRADVTPIVPERRFENLEQRASWVTAEPVEPAEPAEQIDEPVADVLMNPAKSAAPMKDTAAMDILKESSKADAPASDFAEWDATNLRRAQAPPVKRPEPRLRPSLVPERRKPEAPARAVPSVVPSVDPPPVPAAERPPVPVELFRASQMPREISEEAERQGTNWLKWALIAAGPVVLGLVLLIVFTHPSQSPAPTSAKPAATSAEIPAPSDGQLIADATGKPANTTTAQVSKPSPAQVSATAAQPETSDPKPVAPDAMAEQLVAPERIAGNIKTNPTVDTPPPAAPNAVALEDNTAIPGSVFGGPSKAKFVPHVMPISAGVADGMIIRKTQPVYPKFAQDAHITGKVVLKATITKQGSIEGVQVLSGPKILAPAAVDAVKTWKYRPYTLDGQPVAVETTVTIVFGSTR